MRRLSSLVLCCWPSPPNAQDAIFVVVLPLPSIFALVAVHRRSAGLALEATDNKAPGRMYRPGACVVCGRAVASHPSESPRASDDSGVRAQLAVSGFEANAGADAAPPCPIVASMPPACT